MQSLDNKLKMKPNTKTTFYLRTYGENLCNHANFEMRIAEETKITLHFLSVKIV